MGCYPQSNSFVRGLRLALCKGIFFTMDYNILAKETTYKGIKFRSRLEAKWAYFFDEMGWEYQYEPSEINGYNPDFIISCNSKHYECKDIIVEVKPSVFCDEKYIKETIKKYKDVKAHILVLNDKPFGKSKWRDDLIFLGYGSQCLTEEHDFNYPLEFQMKINNDFSSESGIWDGMIHGNQDRKSFCDIDTEDFWDLLKIWVDAGNETRFNY